MGGSSQDSEIILQGFSSADVQDASAGGIQYMQLELTNEVLEQLLESTRLGTPPRIHFGPSQTLRFNNETLSLSTTTTKTPYEIYETKNDGDSDLEFLGPVGHTLKLRATHAASDGMDKAVEQLKHSMAKYEQERKEKSTIMTPEIRPLKGKPTSKPSSSRSAHTSSTLQASRAKMSHQDEFPSHVARPDDELEGDYTAPIKYALVHLLAIDRCDFEQIQKKLRVSSYLIDPILEKVADGPDSAGNYSLSRKLFKELDPYAFPYSNDEARTKAITNAIRAFDSMRIDPHDDAWQILLPESGRYQGKTLSKLKLHGKDASTPNMRPVTLDKKTHLPKRPDAKKEKPKKAVDSQKPEKSVDLKKRPDSTKSPKESGTPKNVKRPTSSTQSKLGDKASRLKEKPSTAAKSLLNKPKNPSPLAKSPPVNASDFEDNHPVHRVLSASPTKGLPSNSTGLKRKAGDMTPSKTTDRPLSKQPRLVNPPPKRKDVTATAKPAQKRKADDDHEQDVGPPRKAGRDVNSTSASRLSSSTRPIVRAPQMTKKVLPPPAASVSKNSSSSYNTSTYSQSSASDSSSPDPGLRLSARQRLELAMKFKRYYTQYQKLYAEVSQAKGQVTAAELEEFWKQHNKIAEMKEQLQEGVLRQ